MKLKSSNAVRFLLALVAFGAGRFLGTIVVRFREAKQPAPVSGHEVVNVAPKNGVDATTSATPTSVPQAETPPEDQFYVARLKTLAEVDKLLEGKLSVPMFGPAGHREKLNPDFVMLFGLTPSETERLDAATVLARQKLRELEARHAMIEKEEDGSISVTIPIFPTDGGLVFDEWQQTTRSILGEQRWAFCSEISPDEFEHSSVFGMFGLQRTEMHVKPMRADNGSPLADTSWGPGSDGGGSHKIVNSYPRMLRTKYPLIHQKLVAGGFLPPEP